MTLLVECLGCCFEVCTSSILLYAEQSQTRRLLVQEARKTVFQCIGFKALAHPKAGNIGMSSCVHIYEHMREREQAFAEKPSLEYKQMSAVVGECHACEVSEIDGAWAESRCNMSMLKAKSNSTTSLLAFQGSPLLKALLLRRPSNLQLADTLVYPAQTE